MLSFISLSINYAQPTFCIKVSSGCKVNIFLLCRLILYNLKVLFLGKLRKHLNYQCILQVSYFNKVLSEYLNLLFYINVTLS